MKLKLAVALLALLPIAAYSTSQVRAAGDYTPLQLPSMGDVIDGAWAINNNGTVAGLSWADGGWHAFTWTEGGGLVDIGSVCGFRKF